MSIVTKISLMLLVTCTVGTEVFAMDFATYCAAAQAWNGSTPIDENELREKFEKINLYQDQAIWRDSTNIFDVDAVFAPAQESRPIDTTPGSTATYLGIPLTSIHEFTPAPPPQPKQHPLVMAHEAYMPVLHFYPHFHPHQPFFPAPHYLHLQSHHPAHTQLPHPVDARAHHLRTFLDIPDIHNLLGDICHTRQLGKIRKHPDFANYILAETYYILHKSCSALYKNRTQHEPLTNEGSLPWLLDSAIEFHTFQGAFQSFPHISKALQTSIEKNLNNNYALLIIEEQLYHFLILRAKNDPHPLEQFDIFNELLQSDPPTVIETPSTELPRAYNIFKIDGVIPNPKTTAVDFLRNLFQWNFIMPHQFHNSIQTAHGYGYARGIDTIFQHLTENFLAIAGSCRAFYPPPLQHA